ncbi:MAG TPA: DNA/RNA non-specific endonuclease [Pyrinomonadaceae bacterium]|nr:DNA/RNA non-specific endonuclease [Chloracidobacterium sp.]MBP9107970.1 DNA/RNA non-specific endonuclease [Pyrinomonadaceae bacterium]MBK7801716.1 DNA/RNA non-specific endonuclease [Chloracidobacterium sp.]MBK9439096.1 DNA/RNA non-specific endonuclease [Chloracidobacterium sp.]MBL0242025.1 DNA/RNA non-specific endonuclease [Chloracidobacterium sp.]
MKKYLLGLFVLSLAVAGVFVSYKTTAESVTVMPSPNIVISQLQPGTTAVPNDEFIELHNIGAAPVDLNGYTLVYRSSSGSNDVGPMAAWNQSTIVLPGQYYLVASTSYTGTATPDLTYNPTTCSCSLSATAGGMAIRQGAVNSGAVIDAIGWGAASNIFFENTRTAAPGSGNSQARLNQGCQDTDNNANDFAVQVSSGRNMATPLFACSGGGTTLFAALTANPATVIPGGSTLLTVTVIPATTPPSTGITVVGNLTAIGGSATQTFYDDGTNGDETSGDNIYSVFASIPVDATGGVKVVTALASDAEARTVSLTQNITVSAPLPDEDPLIFGNPSNATGSIANETNYLMQKPQYSLSYHRTNGRPNWVAWRLDSSWIGGASRQDDYRADPALPAGWYQVQDNDYSGSGYDRGHMCPSGDRTRSIADNSATFLMTNFVPQLGANNQGPWNDFENYCRTLASQGNEIYIITGPSGNIGTIAAGHVVIPAVTWKVVLVLPNGSNDLSRVSRATRAFGIIVSNQPPITSTAWRNYRVTVDQVENLTGYNFFSNIPKITQELIERKRDKQ